MIAQLLLAGNPTTPAATSQASIFPYPLRTSRLENGLTVIRIPFHSPGLIAYVTVVRVGSGEESDPGKTGFAHFFEHMMFRGTTKHPGSARDERLSALGFEDSAQTYYDLTLFHSFGPANAIEELIDFEADRFQNLSYDEGAFRTEALAVRGEYHKDIANPGLTIEQTLHETVFRKHPYGHVVIGRYEDILAMPEQFSYSQEFFRRWYRPDNAYIVVAGDFDDARLLSRIREAYGGWRAGAAPKEPAPEPPQEGPRRAVVEWKGPAQPRVVVAWRVPGADPASPSEALAALATMYLAGPLSPLVEQALLENRWIQASYNRAEAHRAPSVIELQATLRDEAYRSKFVALLDRQVGLLRAGKVDPERFRAIQSAERYQTLMTLETPGATAFMVAFCAAIYGDPKGVEIHLQNVASATPEQLVAFARRYLTDDQRTMLDFRPAQSPTASGPGGAHAGNQP